jgi:uncharacterized Zn-binding protein involved in type VI secretion
MPPALAARRTDATTHGGAITDGAPTVRIGGEPAARFDDPHTCPLSTEAGTPHVGGVITEGSRTVRIGRKAAARMGDSCDCNTVGLAGSGVPESVASGEFDRDGDRTTDGCRDARAARERHDAAEGHILGIPVFGSVNAEGVYRDSEQHAHGDSSGLPGFSVAEGGEVGLIRGRGTVGIGPSDRPFAALGGQVRGGRLQQQGSAQWGDSGRETGAGYGLHLGGDVVNLQGGLLIDARVARIEASVDDGVGLGVESEQGWRYDHEEGALHVRTGLGVHPLPGFNIELTIPNPWRDSDADVNAGIPNVIAEGCPSVRIG